VHVEPSQIEEVRRAERNERPLLATAALDLTKSLYPGFMRKVLPTWISYNGSSEMVWLD